MQRHVLVLGGGYAGVMAAVAARSANTRVTLIDATGTHDFLPRLATVAAGAGPESDASAPLADLIGDDVEVLTSSAASLDHQNQLVKTDDGQVVAYDALVVSTGARSNPPAIPGLADHAWTLRTAEQALALRAKIETSERLVIVGGGATGTQLAGEVSARRPDVEVSLVEMSERIIPNLPSTMSARAASILVERGVRVITRTALSEVAVHGASFRDGTELAGLVVWSGGFGPPVGDSHPLLGDAMVVDGRVQVDRAAQVPGHGPVFAAGDLAGHRGPGGRLLPQTAQVAVRAGSLAGANAARVAKGRRARPGSLRHIGWVVPLGGGQAVAQVGPLLLADPLTSRLAPMLHDVIDSRHLLDVGGPSAALRHRQQPVGLPL